jgi:hypothetical protein
MATKVGAEITIALAMSHREGVNWEKISATLAKDENGQVVEMQPFLAKAKKYSQKLVSPSSSATPAVSTNLAEVP